MWYVCIWHALPCFQIFSRLHDGDLLAITYGYDGFLAYSVNNTAEGRLCCCDLLKTLWLFLDLSGNIESLYMVGGMHLSLNVTNIKQFSQ